jgi:ribokinase
MILVFGSINVDLVVPVQRLPRPGETLLGGDYALLPGGKGANQAMAAARAGAEVVMVGAVGHDAFAAVALDPLAQAGIDIGLVRRGEASTGCAAIMVAEGGENLIAVASGANAKLRADFVPDRLLRPATLLVAQMEVPPDETIAVLRRARGAGGRTIVNLAPAVSLAPDALREIDFIVANEGEAATLGAEPAQFAEQIGEALVVTRGAKGACAYLRDGGLRTVPALPIAPIDTTGAGDTFVGVLAAGLDRGAALAVALREASAAAGLACLARGAQTAMPDRAAIDAALAGLPQHPTEKSD